MAETKIPVGIDEGVKTIHALRELSKQTGILHELQAKNLRIWAMGMLDLSKVQVGIDLETCKLEFTCVYRAKKPANLDWRLHYLDSSCRLLLGSAYHIQVIAGDDVIWDNRQEIPWPSQTSQTKKGKRSRRGKSATSHR